MTHAMTKQGFDFKLWLLSMPWWRDLLVRLLRIQDVDLVLDIMVQQTGFYLIFIFNHAILDATLAGLGLTRYLLYQSIVINIFYYGVVFWLYKSGVLLMSLPQIGLIFGVGMLLDLLPSVVLYGRALNDRGITWRQILS